MKGHYFAWHKKNHHASSENKTPDKLAKCGVEVMSQKQTELCLNTPSDKLTFTKKENTHPELFAFNITKKRFNTKEAFKKVQFKKIPFTFKSNTSKPHKISPSKNGDGWKIILKILAISALILLIIGILYVGIILILIGGVLTGGAIFSEPRFILFLILLGVFIVGAIILSLYIMDAKHQ